MTASVSSVLPQILLLEDEPLFVLGWETMLAGEAQVLAFPNPEALFKALEREAGLLAEVRIAILDQFYGPKSQLTGLQFAPRLRGLLPPGIPIYLASTGLFPDEEEIAVVDRLIEKVPVDYAGLLAYNAGRGLFRGDG